MLEVAIARGRSALWSGRRADGYSEQATAEVGVALGDSPKLVKLQLEEVPYP